MEPQGHNSKEQLKSIVERVERLAEEIKGLRSDTNDIFAEAKGNGFDVKALRQIIRLRAEDPNKRAEREAILETYMNTLGML
jgi:uncharacterized protein (UPF0335 family)